MDGCGLCVIALYLLEVEVVYYIGYNQLQTSQPFQLSQGVMVFRRTGVWIIDLFICMGLLGVNLLYITTH